MFEELELRRITVLLNDLVYQVNIRIEIFLKNPLPLLVKDFFVSLINIT